MRYELDNEGYVLNVYFGCYSGSCTEYTGTIPTGYESLLEWSEKANINAYYINDGNLVYDAYRDAKLQEQYEIDAERNATATVGYVDDILNRQSSPFDETLAKTTTDLRIEDAGNYEIPEIVIENKELFDVNNITTGVYPTVDGGTGSSSAWNTTDYMRVIPSEKYCYKGLTIPGNAPYSHYYDENKNFISSFKQATGENIITVPSNACYVKFPIINSGGDNDLETFSFKRITYEDGIKLQVSNANLLINTGKQETINGITFTPTEDGRVHIKGTATADVEYELCGTMDNKTPMFMMEGLHSVRYVLGMSLPMKFTIMAMFDEDINDCVKLNLYNYNDEGRELIVSCYGDLMEINDVKYVTCATLSIASGTTIDKVVQNYIRKQDGTSSNLQAKAKGIVDINISKLDPNKKIIISGNYVKVVDDKGNEEVIKTINPLLSYENNEEYDYTLIQCSEDVDITTTYYTNINVAGFNITTNGLEIEIRSNYDYTQEDIDKAYAYIRGTGTLTEAEMIQYDVNGDGIVNVYDCSYMSQLIKYGITTKKALKFSICNKEVNNMLNFITVIDGNGNTLTNLGADGITTNGLIVDGVDILNRFSNLELNTKTEVGISSKDYLYLRGTDITNDKQHQLIATPNGILAQRKIDGTWNTDWAFQPYYVAGNTLTLDYYMTSGFLTGGGKSVNFLVISPKLLDNISTISLESFKVTIRHPDGGYLVNGATSIDGTIAVYKCSSNAFRVNMTFNTAFTKANNVPISVLIDDTTFKFS